MEEEEVADMVDVVEERENETIVCLGA